VRFLLQWIYCFTMAESGNADADVKDVENVEDVEEEHEEGN
jgi:hypothetical protein